MRTPVNDEYIITYVYVYFLPMNSSEGLYNVHTFICTLVIVLGVGGGVILLFGLCFVCKH